MDSSATKGPYAARRATRAATRPAGAAHPGDRGGLTAMARGLAVLLLVATGIAGYILAPAAVARSHRGVSPVAAPPVRVAAPPVPVAAPPVPVAAPPVRVAPPPATPAGLSSYVRPLVGTARYGHTFPGATVPFGMVQWSPDTQSVDTLGRPASGYFYHDKALRGFSLTHLSGAGCATYQDVPFLPAVGHLTPPAPRPGSHWAWARYSHADEAASPGYYHVRLASGIDAGLTATPHTGMARFAYPRTAAAQLLIDGGGSVNGTRAASLTVVGLNEVRGWIASGDFCAHNRFSYRVYVDAVFNRPVRRVAAWDGVALRPGSRVAAGPHAALVLGFDARRDPVVLVRVGLSYVDVAGARRNLRAENSGWDVEGVRRAAAHRWDSMLGRIRVGGGTIDQKALFYTALYHALLAPTICSDVDGAYRGLDDQVYRARGYTQYSNISGWDIYRGEAQLLAWIAPRETSGMIRSLLAAARQGGGLPKWLIANRSLSEMVGDPAAPIIADAYAFGARGFDAAGALRAMVSGATGAGPGRDGYVERPGLGDYLTLGYEPEFAHGLPGAVSVTLEYALADFAVSSLARALREKETARTFLRRAQSWRTLYNPATGYIEPRWPDGTFRPAFAPADPWLYIEGNAAQYSWFVPHDMRGLIAAMGGDGVVQGRLDSFFTRLNAGPSTPYAWMGNEPSLLVPWAYMWAGAPWRTQAVVRRIMAQLYDTGPGGLPGNDDLGAMSAWYVWAALGLYPAVPGTDVLVVHGPLFPLIHVSVPGARLFTIVGQGAGLGRPYVQGVTLDGRARPQSWLTAKSLHPGSILRVALGALPDRGWGAASADRPPSFGPDAGGGQ